jgi:cystathionine beta-lyase/cystathionine gamma-synthase
MSATHVTQNHGTQTMQFFRHLSCGARIPDSIHAVSVSLPALRDLIAYEQQDPEALKRIPTGYPRFHTHPYVIQIQEYLDRRIGLNGQPLMMMASRKAAAAVSDFAEVEPGNVIQYKSLTGLVLPKDKVEKARAIRQHTGTHISSRRAEDFLIEEGLLQSRQAEESFSSGAESHVLRLLKEAYQAESENDVYLANAGMNAVYSVYRAIQALQSQRGKNTWIQFGWLFMDTMRLLEKLKAPGTDYCAIYDVSALEELRALLRRQGDRIAGIITEAPSNPLIRTPNLEELKRLAEQYGCALVIDSTLGTPHNVDVLPHADVVIESLTKYANGAADVMMGALILNSSSPYNEGIKATLSDFLESPYIRDINRLAFQISGYAERMQKVNENTMALVDFLKTRQIVKRIYWAYQEESKANYERIQRAPNSPGGMITLELAAPLASVYDRLKIAKGPSLGAEFTLVGPYLYHAHYDLVSSATGKQFLQSKGLDPELLRISVGIEPIADLIATFSEAMP